MDLGDRMKRYESVTQYIATPRTPLMIRVDGRAFHTFTRDLAKPFDQSFINAMVNASIEVAKEMQGFKVAYIQSDEATFCITDYDKLESQGWFDYNLSKIISVSASLMTAYFNKYFKTEEMPVFDSRAFSVPASDIVNAFLWRAKDWKRNSLQMYARAYYGHKELQGKSEQTIHDMLYDIGKNWALDLTSQQKNGTFLIMTSEGIEKRYDVFPGYQSINAAIGHLFDYP